ncbi:hypothetical protein Val02_32320 [Virgisporangium aliadipatigenens]|uniref:Uncharacterized protein n=1 Tax=Virgisporangium aliadipatigenens TaxID=741659 RepID=A0A8J4DQT4_9ACTN|nr:hypothetical protein [Virgisporangium aliadipatigenens]GIJ46346.1 hypothetical protein Val02_32320 [Virgisporangium aliadipatigenens]
MKLASVCVGFPLAGLLFVAAYHRAERDAGWEHELYWGGVALAVATAGAAFALSTDRRRAGAWLTVVLAVLLSLPKFLRAPAYFNFYDEQAHVRAAQALLDGLPLFAENPLNRVVADYPGLHAATAALAAATGGSVFETGNLVVLLARCAGCVAVFLLAERLVRAPAAALLAALVFVANPAFAFFDAQFAYESVAAPLVALVLLLALNLAAPAAGRTAALVAATVLSGLVVITHHGSAYLLAGLLVLVVLGQAAARRRPSAHLVALAAGATAATVAWLFTAASYTLTYVGPYVRSNLMSIPEFLTGETRPRRLFGGFLPTPAYERYASYAAVLILFGLYCWGGYAALRRRNRLDPWVCAALGAIYFGSIPLVVLRGDQVVKRLWEFAFIGLAPVCALALATLVARRKPATWLATAAMLLVVFVGSGVMRSGEHIRFPGPYLPSADPRSMTPDVVAAARWLAGRTHDERVTGDRTLAALLGSVGEQIPVTYQEDGYPVWKIVAAEELTPAVFTEIRRARLDWIAVDLRTAGVFPLTGFYFDESEPGAYVDTQLSRRALTKFDAPGFRRAYDNGTIVLYEVAG